MSADNIGYCPKCKKLQGIPKEVPASDTMSNTLREYQGCHLDQNGIFFVEYECHCPECGFTWEFKHTTAIVHKRLHEGSL